MSIDLDDVNLTGVEEHPPTESVKLYGPPGTGKTTQSAGRVARLIRDEGYSIGDVAWVTYRRSLAAETLQKLAGWGVVDDTELKNPTEGATRYIGTTHAVANRSVGGAGDVVSFGHKKEFCDEWNLQLKSRRPWDDPAGELLFEVFDYAAENLLDPRRPSHLNQVPMVDDLREKWGGDIGSAWDAWCDYKRDHGVIDYHEMLSAPLESETSLDRPIFVVDEYHDATPLMAKLSEFWMRDAEVVIVAGDPNQVVNDYAGASPEFFRRIDLPEILLDRTYRVPYEHWGVAERMLENAHSPPSVARQSRGGFKDAESPTFRHDTERGWSVPGESEVYSPVWFVEEHGADTMFLTRTQKQADGIAYALERAGILYKTQRSMSRDGWGTHSDEDMATRTAVYNALQKLKGIRRGDVIDTGAEGYGLDAFTGSGTATGSDITGRELAAPEAAALLDHANHQYLAQGRSDTTDTVSRILSEGRPVTVGDLAEHVEPSFWDDYTRGAGSVRHLNGTGARTDRLSGRDTDALKQALQRNDGPVGQVETRVYTIHASKGSEAETVVAYDGVTQRIAESVDADEGARCNEWRTWYVALTRSEKRLYVLRGGFDWMTPFLPDNLGDMARQGAAEAEAEAADPDDEAADAEVKA